MFNLSDDAWGDDPETAAPTLPSRATITAGLTPAQAAAAAHDGAILVLAGAGTGKTKTLTAGVALRIAEQGIHPSRILCVTFTNKAAAEMKGRIAAMLAGCELPGWVGTFHGFGARQLRADPEVGGLRENFDILDADDSKRMVKRIVKAMNLCEAEEAGPDECDPVKMICGLIGKLKDRLVPAKQAISYVESLIARENQRRAAVDAYGLRLAARVYLEYQRRLCKANSADFGDLLLWPALTMLRDPEYRERWASRFDWVTSVDERGRYPRPPGTNGRPRTKGRRLPNLSKVLTDPTIHWDRVTVPGWYGGGEREIEVSTDTAVWRHGGMPIVPIRWILVRDPIGRFESQALLCTNPAQDSIPVLRWFVQRWQVEVTFRKVRDHLGVEIQRQWADTAIARTTPYLLGLFSIVTLLGSISPLTPGEPQPPASGIASNARPSPTPSLPCTGISGRNRVSAYPAARSA